MALKILLALGVGAVLIAAIYRFNARTVGEFSHSFLAPPGFALAVLAFVLVVAAHDALMLPAVPGQSPWALTAWLAGSIAASAALLYFNIRWTNVPYGLAGTLVQLLTLPVLTVPIALYWVTQKFEKVNHA